MNKVKLRIMGLMIVLTVFALSGCGGSGSDGIVGSVGSVGTDTAGLQHLVFLRGTSDRSSAALYVVREDGAALAVLDATPGQKYFEGAAAGRVVYRLSPASGEYDIYSIKTDGTGRVPLAADPLAIESVSAVTDNGRVIYSTNTNGGDLYSIHVDGSGLTTLAATEAGENFQAVLPDGRVVYSSLASLGSGRELYIVNADGSGTLRLTDGSTINKQFRALTADGSIIYEKYTSDYPATRDIYLVKPDGTGTIPLATAPDIEAFQAVAPDGSIIYGLGSNLYKVNPDGTGTLQLTDVLSGRVTVRAINEQNRIIYSVGTHETITYWNGTTSGMWVEDLHAVNTDGTDPVLLAGDSTLHESFAGLTADGKVVYVTTEPFSYTEDIQVVGLDGAGTLPLAADPAARELFRALTPDDRVIYDHWTDGLSSVRTDGTGTVALDPGAYDTYYDGEMTDDGRIIYTRTEGDPDVTAAASDLYLVDADGGNRRAVTRVGDVYELQAVF